MTDIDSTNRFGWKAIPLALDDLDSNYTKQISAGAFQGPQIQGSSTYLGEHVWRRHGERNSGRALAVARKSGQERVCQ
jgi:hypothetical protein